MLKINKFHHSLLGNLSLGQSFENYQLALQNHERERELAAQNYGGWNYIHSTAATVKAYKRDLLFAFNRR